MNKSVKKLLAVLLMVLVVSQLGMLTAFADYGYTVRVYAGDDATFAGGGTVATFSGDEYSPERVESLLSGMQAGVNYDSKYYVMGFRKSGRDNNTIDTIPDVITEDTDFVVAYGIRGKLVEYTIYFVDEAGNQIHEPKEYVGNVGDKPVVSFLYIDGYEPVAERGTKTLVDGVNEWYFRYNRIVVATPEPSATPAPAEGGSATDTGEEAGDTENGRNAEGGETAAGAEDQTAIDEEEAPLDEGPRDLIDLDEEDAPLADQPKTEQQKELAKDRTMMFASIGILSVALAALTAFIILLVKTRKEEKDNR